MNFSGAHFRSTLLKVNRPLELDDVALKFEIETVSPTRTAGSSNHGVVESVVDLNTVV
jgi:hypothetical protein